MTIRKADQRQSLPQLEEEILQYWDERGIFLKSLEQTKKRSRYSFYDGPPFATGTPHYGHLVASTMKDVVPRYWTMRGYYVPRRWGWDCHGLPIENIAEKELGIKRKKDIEEMGVAQFNEFCRSKVLGYVDEWKRVIRRLGRWADMEHAYKTMDRDYMESVWSVFKGLWDKDLVYESYRVMYVCPRCETTLSQQEVSEGYAPVKDLTATVKFELDQTVAGDIVAAAIERDGKLLFVYHSGGRQYLFPGGKVEPGESPEEALVRECREEIGVEVAVGEKLYQSYRVYFGQLKRVHVYQTTLADGAEPRNVEPDKHREVIWREVKRSGDERETSSDIEMNRFLMIRDGSMPRTIDRISLLAWTTTPWTLPGNAALAVGRDIGYAMVYSQNFPGELLILSASSLEKYKEALGEYETLFIQSGAELVGVSYLAPFDAYWKDTMLANYPNGWKVYAGDFVTDTDGTGIVHIAPAFGEDDMALGQRESLPFVQHVNYDGTVKPEVAELAGQAVRTKEYPQTIDINVIKYLASGGLLFAKEKYEHEYPLCWRCDTPLINYATSSWFVSVLKVKERALELAREIDWSPAHIKEGRFGKWLEGARDWSISRQRYWATPIPIWKCQGHGQRGKGEGQGCGQLRVFGSAAELEEASGQKVDDLHKHLVDGITFTCGKCGGEMRRVLDVLDTWFDSGSMPYASAHYPFENKAEFEAAFPAQFIAEGVDQTRAWFYYLHVLATALHDKAAFQHAIVNGTVLAEDGKKMSKRLQNYPDPTAMLEKYGADVLRLYLMSSPVVAAENLNFSEKEMGELARGPFRMLWNSYAFFTLYAEIDGWYPGGLPEQTKLHLLDRWILSELQALVGEVNSAMEAYALHRAARAFAPFIDHLSNWYIRRSRKRFWKNENDADKEAAYATLHHVLVELAKLMAPFTPFIAEEIYRNLTGEESVHLAEYPTVDAQWMDEKLNNNMRAVREIVTIGLQKRAAAKIKVRQPLASVSLGSKYEELFNSLVDSKEDYYGILEDELNIKKVSINILQKAMNPNEDEQVILDTNITPELKLEGDAREIVRVIQEGRKKAGLEVSDRITLGYEGMEEVFANAELKEMIAREVLATGVSAGLFEGGYQESTDLDGQPFAFSVRKV